MMSSLDAVLSQYEKNTQPFGDSNKMSQEDRMKKYFACILPQNQSQGQRRVRILPTPDGSSPFKEVWYHELQVGGKWQKFYDPGKNDNERSPLNEVHEELMSTGKDSDKELAKQYKSRKFYIVKVIDRDAEEEGVKFWRFKHNYKNDGILDKIIPIWRQKGDVTDADKGRDLIVQLVKSKTPGGKDYTSIQTIMHDDPSTLHETPNVKEEWLKDTMTWSDVYSKKPVEYLEALSRGEEPRWDSETGKYLYGDSSSMMMGGAGGNGGAGGTTSPFSSDPQLFQEPAEDLPF